MFRETANRRSYDGWGRRPASGIPFGVLCEMRDYDDPDGAPQRAARAICTVGLHQELTLFPQTNKGPHHGHGHDRTSSSDDVDEVARHIGNGAAAILPIGRAQGTWLPPALNTDPHPGRMACQPTRERFDALIWPTLNLRVLSALSLCRHSSLSSATFEAVVHEIASGILGNGCRKLLVLDTGISTLAPVERALARLDAGKVLHLRIHDGPRYRQAAAG